MYNILEHSFVPEHTIISDEEFNEIKKQYNINNNSIPIIYRTDAVAMYLGMRSGQICRITRKSESSGITTVYRQCI